MATKNPNPAALAAVSLQLVEVDPTQLLVDDQVRGDATPDDDLIASVRRMGVLQPPTVFWDEERGAYVIVMGHRRVGAAIIAKIPTIQVLVRDAAEARDAARIERQLVENELREELTSADVARGYKDMALLGLRPEDIAARVADRPQRVKAALKATESEAATAALAKGIDLEQAAIIAEFDGDPETQKHLTTTAVNYPASFHAEANRERSRRELVAKRAELEAQLADEGVELVDTVSHDPEYWRGLSGTRGATLAKLGIIPETHTTCPGHGAIISGYAPDRVAISYVCTDIVSNEHEILGVAPRELTSEEQARAEEMERRREAEREAEEAAAANSLARRDWLRGFIGGRLNQTAGLFDFIAAASIGAADLDQFGPHEHPSIAIYILTGQDIRVDWREHPIADMIADGRVAPLRALTADALATGEAATMNAFHSKYAPRLATAYFAALTSWGYELTELDKEIQQAAADALAEDEPDEADEADEADIDEDGDE